MSSAWATLSDYYQPPTARDILALASMQDQAEDRKERRRLLAMQEASDRNYTEEWNRLAEKAYKVKQQTMQTPAQGQGGAFDMPQNQGTGPTVIAARTQAIGQRLKGLGMSDDQIAGSLGGLSTETAGFDPNAVNPKTGAFGIGQWLGDRLKALKQYAAYYQKPINDFETQLNFLDQELRFGEKTAFDAIQGATTREGAANAWIDKFERSDAPPALRAKGVQYAQNFAGLPATDAGGGRTEPSQPADDFRPARSIGDIQARIDFEKQQRAQVAEIRKPLDQIQAAYDANSDNAGWQKYLDEEKQKYAGNTAMQEEFDFRKRFNVGGPKGTQNYDGPIDNSAIEWAKGKLNPQAMAWLQSQWGRSLNIGAENGIITKAGPSTIDTKSKSKEQLAHEIAKQKWAAAGNAGDPPPQNIADELGKIGEKPPKTDFDNFREGKLAELKDQGIIDPGVQAREVHAAWHKQKMEEAAAQGSATEKAKQDADMKEAMQIVKDNKLGEKLATGVTSPDMISQTFRQPWARIIAVNEAIKIDPAFNEIEAVANSQWYRSSGAQRLIRRTESIVGENGPIDESIRLAKEVDNPIGTPLNKVKGQVGVALGNSKRQLLNLIGDVSAEEQQQIFGAQGGGERFLDLAKNLADPNLSVDQYVNAVKEIRYLITTRQVANVKGTPAQKRWETLSKKYAAERPFVKGGETGKPDPAIEAKIKEISGQHTPEEISGFLKEKGVDPTIYGLPK